MVVGFSHTPQSSLKREHSLHVREVGEGYISRRRDDCESNLPFKKNVSTKSPGKCAGEKKENPFTAHMILQKQKRKRKKKEERRNSPQRQ